MVTVNSYKARSGIFYPKLFQFLFTFVKKKQLVSDNACVQRMLHPFSFSIYFAAVRVERCQVCYSHLQHIRRELDNSTPLLTNMASKYKLHDAFTLLD